jgi:hypothetical protein
LNTIKLKIYDENKVKQAGAELCQAQFKLWQAYSAKASQFFY